MTTQEVYGRNGFKYDATHVSGDVFIVGKFLVIVVDGMCRETIGPATKKAVAAIVRRGEVVGTM